MRLALYQGLSPSGDIPAAFEAVEKIARAAAAAGADMALFPELFLPGYNAPIMVSQSRDGAWLSRLTDIAGEAGVAIAIGFAETRGAQVFNSAVAIAPGGEVLALYRKIQLYGPRERRIFDAGESYSAFEYAGRKIGFLICYDVEFPEHCRALAQAGAEVILVPTANPKPFDNVNRIAVAARALENGVTVAYCNYCGDDGDISYTGASVIAAPDGATLAAAGPAPALLIVDLPAPGVVSECESPYLADLVTL